MRHQSWVGFIHVDLIDSGLATPMKKNNFKK